MKKISLLFTILLALTFSVTAMPGTDRLVKDSSGEYIYYSDQTFKTPSFIGFLYYDENTYALRYTSKEKDISTYLSVQNSDSALKITGERIVGATLQEDTEIVNYLHDLFYEFTSRRNQVSFSSLSKVTNEEEYQQFGGKVQITYSPLVPVTGIECIASPDGNKLFTLMFAGKLSSSEDTSFTDYKGENISEKDGKRKIKKSKAESVEVNFEGTTVTLDSSWTQNADNFFLHGENALVTLSSIPLPEEYSEKKNLFASELMRLLSQCPAGDLIPWHSVTFEEKENNSMEMTFIIVDKKNKSVTRAFHKIIFREDANLSHVMLTVFDGAYQKNRSYYNGVWNSIR